MEAPTPLEDLAAQLGVSTEAVGLARDAEVVDLHLDSFIPHRLWGYDWWTRHDGGGPLGRHFFGHMDWPRLADGGLSSGQWSITTNPFRSAGSRWTTFQRNLDNLQALIAGSEGKMRLVTDHAAYQRARADGAHAAMIAIQGGNALDAAPEGLASIDDLVLRVTLVHLTNSWLGATNSPHHKVRSDKGLTAKGRAFVEQCNDRRVFVDLAHIHEKAFWDAVEVHDARQPLVVTHAGVDGVRPHWRNLTDEQIRTVADTGGVIGVIFEPNFLARRGGPRTGEMVIEHLEHIIDVAGEDAAALGSDFDGAIRPPADIAGGHTYPVLVQYMLDRGWSESRIRKVLGENFLRSFAALRPG